MNSQSPKPVSRRSPAKLIAAALALISVTLSWQAITGSAADETTPPAFGPTVETTLLAVEVRTAELLDLDTGKRAASTTFGENDRETHAWIRTNKMDVLGVVEKGQIAVLCCDMAVVPAASNSWDVVTPQQVVTNWGLGQQEPNKITPISTVTEKTDTFLFRTREGGLGVLQILGRATSPTAVKIRYRLLRPAAKS